MTVKDKAAGTLKELTGEIIGDGKLAEEGKAQRKDGSDDANSQNDQKPLGPLEHLRNLT